MSRKRKPIEVQKFGGVDELGKATLNGHTHEVSSVETQSETKLEDDTGSGIPVIIRCFTFGANPEAFKDHVPTKQELFDAHKREIEMRLWVDGMVYYDHVEPRLVMGKDKYQIFIAALPARGQLLHEKPRTLSEIAHG